MEGRNISTSLGEREEFLQTPLRPPDYCAFVPDRVQEHPHVPWMTEGKALSEADVGGPPALDPLPVRTQS